MIDCLICLIMFLLAQGVDLGFDGLSAEGGTREVSMAYVIYSIILNTYGMPLITKETEMKKP